VASAVGYWLSRKALAPVDALTRTARSISGANLNDRLEGLQTGDELQRLSDTLNEMLARIEAAFLRVSQFTADASHELRTPVSLIRTEAEIALRKSRDETAYREALTHILTEAERTSSLIEELLFWPAPIAGRESLNNAGSLICVTQCRRPRVTGGEGPLTKACDFRKRRWTEFFCHSRQERAHAPLEYSCSTTPLKYTPSPGDIELTWKRMMETL